MYFSNKKVNQIKISHKKALWNMGVGAADSHSVGSCVWAQSLRPQEWSPGSLAVSALLAHPPSHRAPPACEGRAHLTGGGAQ